MDPTETNRTLLRLLPSLSSLISGKVSIAVYLYFSVIVVTIVFEFDVGRAR